MCDVMMGREREVKLGGGRGMRRDIYSGEGLGMERERKERTTCKISKMGTKQQQKKVRIANK